ncbi:MAG: hypothetical protein C0418_05910, partial [Coriobacteriaceae bacterium]|nr:hypothetical protein [Coriobacteriaceae bacterium]
VVSAEWGTGPGRLGRVIGQEGDPLGPSSMGVDDRGRVYVLDAANERVVRFVDGSADREWKLPGREFEDLVVSRDRFAVLDRWDDRRVLVFDADGGVVATLPIASQVPALMHLSIVDGEVLVEAPGTDRVAFHAIGRLDGTVYEPSAQARRRAEGAVTPAGTVLVARRTGKNDASVDVLGKDGRVRSKLRAHASREVAAIVDITGDREGSVWVVWALHKQLSKDTDERRGWLVVSKFAPDGELLGSVQTDDSSFPEPFRRFALSEEGELYQLVCSEQGTQVLHWTLGR